MYNAAADIHLSGVYTPSHEIPTATPNSVMTINIFGLQLPKSEIRMTLVTIFQISLSILTCTTP